MNTWPDPPSTDLQPYVDDDAIIDAALDGMERRVRYTVGAPSVADRDVWAARLAQITDLRARRGTS